MNYKVDEQGFYGDFGGAFIPEMLYHNINELKEIYLPIIKSIDFKNEFKDILKEKIREIF